MLLSFIMLVSCSESDDVTKKVVIGMSADYPPFEYKNQDQIVGYDVDLANILSKELGISFEIQDIPFDNLITALKAGRIDMILSAMTATPERAEVVDFSNIYCNNNGISLLFNLAKPISPITDLAPLVIGVQIGTITATLMKKNSEILHFELLPFEDNASLIEALKSGKIDAVVIETLQAQLIKQNNNDLGYIELSQLPMPQINDIASGVAIAFRKGSNLRDRINVALEKLAASGKLKELESKWLKKH